MPAATPSESRHVSVLLYEVLRELKLADGLIVVDGTVGGGGHSREIATRIHPGGRLIGFDRDPMMLSLAQSRLAGAATLVQGSYLQLPEQLKPLGLEKVDRILLDLGYSSDQLLDDQRGFRFDAPGPLDLRFDTSQGEPAWQWLAEREAGELTRIFAEYGEEPHAKKLADQIVMQRRQRSIETAQQFAEVVCQVLGAARSGQRHPATQVFQALRIAVNAELQHVERAVSTVLPQCLAPGGMAVVITFHSLEDRLVKQAFKQSQWWVQPPMKVVEPTPNEVRFNPRSRSAKLRVAIRNDQPYSPPV